MCPRTALRLVPGMLCALLLLGGVLSTQQQGKEEDWDHPTCTQDPVTVPQGQQAVMTCNISNTYAQVIVSLTGPGGHSEELFDVKAPNYISRDGWQLRVQGRVAQLLVAKAELNQTGTYTWTLQGKQWEHRSTVLNVTEPPFGAAVGSGGLPWCGDPGCAGAEEEPRPAAGALRALPKDRSQSAVLWSVAFAALCVLALLCAVEGKRGRCMQFSATKCMEEQESDHMQLTSGLQP